MCARETVRVAAGAPMKTLRVNVPIYLVLLRILADAPRQWVDDADLFVKYTAWLESIGGRRQ